MRILLVSNYQPPHMGGIEFAAEALKACWEAKGHEVTWLTTDVPRGGAPQASDNIRIPAFNGPERWLQVNTPLVSPTSLPRLSRIVAEYDVINIQSFAPGLTASVLFIAIRQKKRIVVTQHVGVIPHRVALISALQAFWLRHIAHRAIRDGVHLTFVGKAVREWFVDQIQIPEEHITMTPAGINPDDYYFVSDADRSVLKKKWDLDPSHLNVLFVGRFCEKKGMPLIEQVARKCPDIRFSLLGGGQIDPARWHLNNVRILSFVSTPELRELYGCHDLFMMPSFGEGWPAVIPQAMACGLACLVSPEAFEGYQQDDDRFIICERDVEKMTKVLNEAASGEIPLLKKRETLSKYSVEHWNWAKTADIYLELFQRDLSARIVPTTPAYCPPL